MVEVARKTKIRNEYIRYVEAKQKNTGKYV